MAMHATAEQRQEANYSLLLLVIVTLIAILLLVMGPATEGPTGKVVRTNYGICSLTCPAGTYGVPTGSHGNVHFCRCYSDTLEEQYLNP